MPPDFLEYHKSISSELEFTKNRVRQLIDKAHWPSDGEYKESILRKVIRNHLPETHRVGKGFIVTSKSVSTQVDVLITRKDRPILFQDGEFVIVTPDAVTCIIEVKTTLNRTSEVLLKLASTASRVRTANPKVKVGLFVYNSEDESPDQHELFLKHLYNAVSRSEEKVINYVVLGKKSFFRFWDANSCVFNHELSHPTKRYNMGWHSYILTQSDDLAQSYFISNVVCESSGETESEYQFAWFPLKGGKEQYGKVYMPLKRKICGFL